MLTQDQFIEFIENLPDENFDMCKAVPGPECGSPGCIGGWAAWLLAQEHGNGKVLDIEDALQQFFPAVDMKDIEATCYPVADFGYRSGYDANRFEAAQVLRNLKNHGEPRWDLVMGECQENHEGMI